MLDIASHKKETYIIQCTQNMFTAKAWSSTHIGIHFHDLGKEVRLVKELWPVYAEIYRGRNVLSQKSVSEGTKRDFFLLIILMLMTNV